MRKLLEDRTAAGEAGEAAIFYWWTPDPLISVLPAASRLAASSRIVCDRGWASHCFPLTLLVRVLSS
jgi:hypothetical protein